MNEQTSTSPRTDEQGVREIVDFEARSARSGRIHAVEAFTKDADTVGIRHALNWHAEAAVKAEWLADFWTYVQGLVLQAKTDVEVAKALTSGHAKALSTLTDGTGHTNQITVGAKASDRQAAAQALELVQVLLGRMGR